MRSLAFLLALFLLAGSARAEWRVTRREPLPATPGTEFAQLEVESEGGSASLHVITAQSLHYTVAVTDDPTGDLRVATAGAARRAVATVNGGYFDPRHEPLGLVLAEGKLLRPVQKAKLLSGLVLAGVKRVSLLRLAEYKPAPAHRDALQVGPFLVEGGLPVPGLNDTRAAARTVVFTADGTTFGLLVLRSATLAETAQILALPGLLTGHPIARALNLDGGSSSGLWVRQPGGVYSDRELKNVRTYLSLVPR